MKNVAVWMSLVVGLALLVGCSDDDNSGIVGVNQLGGGATKQLYGQVIWLDVPEGITISPSIGNGVSPITVRFSLLDPDDPSGNTLISGPTYSYIIGTGWLDNYSGQHSTPDIVFCGGGAGARTGPPVGPNLNSSIEISEESPGVYKLEMVVLGGVNLNNPQSVKFGVYMARTQENGGGEWLGYSNTVQVASPDLNGDLIVNLYDYNIFSAVFNRPESYNFRADFNHDGVINLYDYSYFGLLYGKSCGD